MVFNALPMEERVWQGGPLPRGLFRDVCHVPGNLLNNGVHRVKLVVVEDSAHVIHRMEDVLMFEVRDVSEKRDGWYGEWQGAVRPRLRWDTEQVDGLVTDGS
jgi:lipopolysaccharide transport system ATP-binding protein